MHESNLSGVWPGDGLDATPGCDVDGQPRGTEVAEDGAFAASEDAFQALASDVRLAVLVHLLRAEGAPSFSALQSAVGSDSSAGFAYHLRQLDGRFVRKTGEGYELTPAGRRAARAVLAGTFTDDGESRQAS